MGIPGGPMHFCRKTVEVGLEIIRSKYNVYTQQMTKDNIINAKQSDAIGCVVMVFYYAEKITNDDIFVLPLHTSE